MYTSFEKSQNLLLIEPLYAKEVFETPMIFGLKTFAQMLL